MLSFSCGSILGRRTQGGRSADCLNSALVVIWRLSAYARSSSAAAFCRAGGNAGCCFYNVVYKSTKVCTLIALNGSSMYMKVLKCVHAIESVYISRPVDATKYKARSTKYRERCSRIAFASLRRPVFSPRPRSCAAVLLPAWDVVQELPLLPSQSCRVPPSRDVVPESVLFPSQNRQILPSRDVAQDERHIVLAWENYSFAGTETGPCLHNVPPWERTALLGGEGLRRFRG